jgi:hypothetical protein
LNGLKAPFSHCQDKREELLAKHHNDTCSWLVNDQRFRKWIEDDEKRLLWIHAPPGLGKSVLSAFLVEQIFSHTKSGCIKNFSTAYFFCKGTDERLRTDTAILKYLLVQILHHRHSLLPHFETEPDYRGAKTQWTTGMLWRVFERVWNDDKLENTCLIIDALGEFLLTVFIFAMPSWNRLGVTWQGALGV